MCCWVDSNDLYLFSEPPTIAMFVCPRGKEARPWCLLKTQMKRYPALWSLSSWRKWSECSSLCSSILSLIASSSSVSFVVHSPLHTTIVSFLSLEWGPVALSFVVKVRFTVDGSFYFTADFTHHVGYAMQKHNNFNAKSLSTCLLNPTKWNLMSLSRSNLLD